MKFLRSLSLILLQILLIPLGLIGVTGAIWYALPSVQQTDAGLKLIELLPEPVIFWIILGSAITYPVFYIITRLCNKFLPVKLRNCFTHINAWTMGLAGIVIAIATFIMINPLVSEKVTIGVPKKIGIGVCLGAIILFHLFSRRLSAIINRKIQAYENSKELNVAGKSSVIFINFLKLIELFFPELILLSLLCLCVSWNIACYFITILICSLIPVLGNIECDFATRRHARHIAKMNDDKMATAVANKLSGGK